MDFLIHCAELLDSGVEASSVLLLMRERYKTTRCLNVKTCLVRKMCKLNPEFVEMAKGDQELLDGSKIPPEHFPTRLPKNVIEFRLSRKDVIQCKKEQAKAALQKNSKCTRVDGRSLLEFARKQIDKNDKSPLTILAIMLLTGRRTCEILNPNSAFEKVSRYEIMFIGQAKKKKKTKYQIPVLYESSKVINSIQFLRTWINVCDKNHMTTNQALSTKYQSWLSRNLSSHPIFNQVGHPHSLRGIYAKMAIRLFDWDGDYTEAYIVMNILGHASLQESLVYTTFILNAEFQNEPCLGSMKLYTTHATMASEEEIHSSSFGGKENFTGHISTGSTIETPLDF